MSVPTCLCGAKEGEQHDIDCPYPLYHAYSSSLYEWEINRMYKARERTDRARIEKDKETK